MHYRCIWFLQAKTVRFEESIHFRSPEVDTVSSPETSVSKADKSISLETTVSFSTIASFHIIDLYDYCIHFRMK